MVYLTYHGSIIVGLDRLPRLEVILYHITSTIRFTTVSLMLNLLFYHVNDCKSCFFYGVD